MIALEYLILYNTAITGDLSPLSGMIALEILDLSYTAITGDLSPLSGMLALEYLYLSYTAITGDLSPLSGMIALEYLDLSYTAITGDLSLLVTLGSLQYCVVGGNRLQGPIPSLRNISSLVYLNVANNQLTGSINNIFPESLEILDVSNNQLTGTLHASLFALPNLQVLDASINCLSVQFTEDICSSSSLQYLVLDGLHSSISCRQVLPIHIVDTIYATRLNVVSNIPACMYSLRNLQSLHMAGNGITGALPTNVTLSTSFKELVLANNQMHSTIPTAFQAHDWYTLDLSYNVFVGYLLPSLNVSNSLSLKVNRLSGNIPSSLSGTSDVSILTGNMFTCTSHQLAALHDEEGDKTTHADRSHLIA
jgi:Leucine-rich repeat (LRR) protein